MATYPSQRRTREASCKCSAATSTPSAGDTTGARCRAPSRDQGQQVRAERLPRWPDVRHPRQHQMRMAPCRDTSRDIGFEAITDDQRILRAAPSVTQNQLDQVRIWLAN